VVVTEIVFDRYSNSEIEAMMEWCRQHLRAGSWKVNFAADSTTFVFKRKADSFLFACRWQPQKKKTT
jgi:hypothetical protein